MFGDKFKMMGVETPVKQDVGDLFLSRQAMIDHGCIRLDEAKALAPQRKSMLLMLASSVGEDCGGGVLSEQETGGQAGYDVYGERGGEVFSRPPSSIKSAPSRLKRDDLGFYTEHYTDVKHSIER